MDTFSSLPAPRRRSLGCLRSLCATASLCSALTAFAVSEPSLVTGQKKSFGYSWKQEMQLGAESDKDVVETMGVYDDPNLQAYVAAVGRRVLEASQFNDPRAPEIYRNTTFTFRVIDSTVVNAFALPGGFVYVTRGLLAHLDNEAQLAVVLGHEIGHVAARHSSQQARRSQWTQLGVMAGAILGQKVLGDRAGDIAPALIGAGGQAAQLFLLRYSREAETEADTLGVGYAARSGYAAGESARFFHSLQRISAAAGKSLPTWQSTHPDPGDRAQRVQQLASATPAESRTNVGEGEFLKHIDGLVVGDDPRAGFERDGVFFHPGLRFQMPVAAGWKLDNQHAAVVMAEPNGKAMMGLKLAPGANARDAALQFSQRSKVQILTSGDTFVNGLPTSVIIGQATTDEGVLGVWNAFIEKDGKVFSLLGYAPQAAFEQVRPTFESIAAGFAPLRDNRLAEVQPAHLKVLRADRSAPFAAFVPTSLPVGLTAQEVAIMNQVELNENVPEGRMLKVPEGGAPIPPAPSPAAAYPEARRPANYPDARSRYPYPNQPDYPRDDRGQASRYPNPQNYPNPNYPNPQNYPPSSGYPQNVPQNGYPSSSYPPVASPYPSQPGYPPSNGYPSPSNSGYPPDSSGYPSSANSYPPSSYPGYPPPSAPAQTSDPRTSYPQFPQPPGSRPANPPPAPSSQPAWPR